MKRLMFTVAALGLLSSACAKPLHISQEGPTALPRDLNTYALLSHPVVETSDDANALVHDAMVRKGYRIAPENDARLLVSVKMLRAGDVDRRAIDPNSNMLMAPAVDTEPLGSLDVPHVVMVLLEEASTDRVVWVGWSAGESASHTVRDTKRSSLQKILARIPQSVDPPRATSGSKTASTAR